MEAFRRVIAPLVVRATDWHEASWLKGWAQTVLDRRAPADQRGESALTLVAFEGARRDGRDVGRRDQMALRQTDS